MYEELAASKNVPIKAWLPVKEIEASALIQLKNVADLPWAYSHIAVMPDVHAGVGATIGTVIAMDGAVAPSAVGVDIGCGMSAFETKIDKEQITQELLTSIKDEILYRIPIGFNSHKEISINVKNEESLWKGMQKLPKELIEENRIASQVGTLGGGNHFIELSYDEAGKVWIMLHSGSRHIGLQIANYFTKIAKEQPHNQNLPDKNLAVLLEGTLEFQQYMACAMWAQYYAQVNRRHMLFTMFDILFAKFYHSIPEIYSILDCHHNFAAFDTYNDKEVVITRKGAIRAEKDELGIIPGSMGTKSYIVKGLGNKEAFSSAPHGAGRRMSRSAAKKTYNVSDLENTMSGIVNNTSKDTVDEISYAYKPIDTVMRYASSLVKAEHELTQLLNIKG